ncbi:hypothetical protein HYW94_02220 [Candidatus Uhrbacteria bacterium]|nr:hypothetical protein [Candidatus Uhrbacteria bacterium]
MSYFFFRVRLFVRICLFFGILIFFVWIFNENIPIAGIKKITYTFGTPHGMVSQLRPMARLGEQGRENGISYQSIKEDPVFFDIRTPISYDMLSVEIAYKNTTNKQFGLGIRQFLVQTDFFITPFEPAGMRDGWSIGKAEISLKDIRRMPGKYSLSLSVKGLKYYPDRIESVRVSHMQITLTRKPLISL